MTITSLVKPTFNSSHLQIPFLLPRIPSSITPNIHNLSINHSKIHSITASSNSSSNNKKSLESIRNNRWSLQGMTALVTGGTRGIGHAIVEELLGFGAIVHTCARNEVELQHCLKVWENQGFEVSGSVCDVSSWEQREKLMDDVSSLFNGKLNILLCHPLLKASGCGSVVFVSSVSGFVSLKSMSLQGATKGAINQLVRNLACEWAKDNIRSNAVAPWYIKTAMVEKVAMIFLVVFGEISTVYFDD